MKITPQEIIEFWFTEPVNQQWFNSTQALDDQIRESYESLWEQAASGALDDWRKSPEGCLALVIILDQFPLNMFRGEAKSFSTEQQAVTVTKHALEQGLDQPIPRDQVAFLYMPLMHSESLADQDQSVSCFEASGLQYNLEFARHHREIVRRFGRFPHRNEILGRESTPEEREWLATDEAFKG
jgi:uncharacterized protein (DUF924 family)